MTKSSEEDSFLMALSSPFSTAVFPTHTLIQFLTHDYMQTSPYEQPNIDRVRYFIFTSSASQLLEEQNTLAILHFTRHFSRVAAETRASDQIILLFGMLEFLKPLFPFDILTLCFTDKVFSNSFFAD